MKSYFRQSFESSPESRGSQTSGVLLVLFVQAKSTKNRSLSGNFRDSANLESAHQKSKFVQTKLNPFAASPLFPTFCKVQKVGQKTLKLSFRKVLPLSGQHALRAFRRPWRRFSLPSAAVFPARKKTRRALTDFFQKTGKRCRKTNHQSIYRRHRALSYSSPARQCHAHAQARQADVCRQGHSQDKCSWHSLFP